MGLTLTPPGAVPAPAFNLSKGERIVLEKEDGTSLTKIRAGLSWEKGVDLDVSALLLGANGKVASNSDVVFYGNLTAVGGAVKHSGDKKDGNSVAGDGDDETIDLDLAALPATVEEVVFIASSHSENPDKTPGKPLVFGALGTGVKPVAKIYDASNLAAPLLRFECDEDASQATAVAVGRVYRKDGKWRFAAMSEALGAHPFGLQGAISKYVG